MTARAHIFGPATAICGAALRDLLILTRL